MALAESYDTATSDGGANDTTFLILLTSMFARRNEARRAVALTIGFSFTDTLIIEMKAQDLLQTSIHTRNFLC